MAIAISNIVSIRILYLLNLWLRQWHFVDFSILEIINNLISLDDYHFSFQEWMKPLKKCLELDAISTQFIWNWKPSDTDRALKRCRITLENSATYVVRDTQVGATEEVTAETDTIEEPEVEQGLCVLRHIRVMWQRQWFHQNTLFSLRMFIGDNDAIHYYTGLETYETLLFVLSTLGPEVHVLNYMYGTIS